jgi:phasin family protein
MTDQATDDGKIRPRKGRRSILGRNEPVADDFAVTAAPETVEDAEEAVITAEAAPHPVDVHTTTEARPATVEPPVYLAAPEITGEPAAPATAATQPTAPSTTLKGNTTMDKAIKTSEEIVAFGQGNIEAFIQSSQIWTAGVQDLSKQFAATTQAHFDETMANVKALSSVKSIKEALELQTGFAKAAMEKALAETGKLTDATVKLTEEAMAPITARVTLATETFTRAA